MLALVPVFGDVVLLLAVVGSGLVAGLCFAFASFLMRAFDRLGAAGAIRTMQSINATILRSSAMGVWFGTAAIGVAAAVLAGGADLAIAAAAAYAVGAILVTGLGNVPLNEALDRVDPDAHDAAEVWQSYRVRWGRLNALRTVLCALASAGFALVV